MNIKDFEGTSPAFTPETFFDGELEGWAVLEGPLGGIQRRAAIKASGRVNGTVTHFHEVWTFDDGQVDTLEWVITNVGDGRYSGAEPTLEGEAKGEAEGCAFHWTYTRNVPGKDGSTTKLNFEDWFVRVDENATIVKGSAGRLGLPFASAHVTYRKLTGRAAAAG